MTDAHYLTASEAAAALGITVSTLYSYVSRGLLRSEAEAGSSRARRYPAEDVARLLERRATRRNPDEAASRALRWGAPVLPSSITLIEDGRLYYRGHDTLGLARARGFEEVAALLWTGDLDPGALFEGSALPGDEAATIRGMQAALARAAESDLEAYELAPEAVARTGARIIPLMLSTATGTGFDGSVAGSLQRAWAPGHPDARALLEAALILCADHELNVSAFTVRCVASAGATPYEVVIAGLSALSGFRHGGVSERVELLFREAAGGARETIAGYGRRGEPVPGFGHPLYPAGDPRARLLLELVGLAHPDAPALATARALQGWMADRGLLPNIDFGLVTLARALSLPPGSPLLIFALGRAAGWIAHAIEQYASGALIRPRARYVGVRLETGAGSTAADARDRTSGG